MSLNLQLPHFLALMRPSFFPQGNMSKKARKKVEKDDEKKKKEEEQVR